MDRDSDVPAEVWLLGAKDHIDECRREMLTCLTQPGELEVLIADYAVVFPFLAEDDFKALSTISQDISARFIPIVNAYVAVRDRLGPADEEFYLALDASTDDIVSQRDQLLELRSRFQTRALIAISQPDSGRSATASIQSEHPRA